MRRAVAGAAALVLLSCAAADPAPEARGGPLVLGGPEVAKLDWNTRAMQAGDLDGDGRTDLALLNNDRARVELLYQRRAGEAAAPQRPSASSRWDPVLEDARFRREGVVSGQQMFALAVGDLDSDGMADLAYTGKPDGLTLRFQGPAGAFERKRILDVGEPVPWPASLAVADLDSDGRRDLVVLAQREILVFPQGEKGLGGAERYPLCDEGCYGLKVLDLDGDALPDLAYLASGKREALRVRFRLPKGGYGPERLFRIEAPRGELVPLRGGGGAPAFACIQAQTGLVAWVGLGAEAAGAAGLKPRVFSARTGARLPASYALGDLDGDKRPDLAVGDAEGAQVLLYLQRPEGGFAEGQPFPSLAEVRSLALGDSDGDGRAELFVASPKERSLGVCRLSPEGRLGYPQILPLGGRPLAVAAADLDGDGVLDLACLREEDGRRGVALLSQDRRGGTWGLRAAVEIPALKTDPKAVRVLDADQDGRPDLAVFTAQESLRLLLQQPDGSFREAASPRKGLVDNLEPAQLTLGDVDADGKPELLVASTGFARALRAGADGALEVVDQFNAREGDAEVAAALAADLDGDKTPEIVLVPRKGDGLEVLRRDARRVYRHAETAPAGRIELVGAEAGDLDGDGRCDLLLLGRDRFWWLPTGRGDLEARALGTYETDLKNLSFGVLAAGDLDGDGREDLAAADANEHVLEVLSPAGGAWRRILHFRVFESDPHYQGRRGAPMEPREILVADVTGDGKADLVLLAHDRLLVYPRD